MIGVDSMVIGNIEDLGSFFDVTAKIVASGTGRIQGMADVRVVKDEATAGLVSKARTAVLTIAVDPVVRGSVVAKKAFFPSKITKFTPYPQKENTLFMGRATDQEAPFVDQQENGPEGLLSPFHNSDQEPRLFILKPQKLELEPTTGG